MNDADIATAEMTAMANAAYAARRSGLCTHSSFSGPMGAAQLGLTVPAGKAGICPDCGVAWVDADEWLDSRDEILAEWS